MNRNKKQHIIIVGCGRLGSNLAGQLSESGESVIIVDEDKNSFRKLPPSFGGINIIGDVTYSETLENAGIDKAKALVAVTNIDNINVMVSQIAKVIYSVDRVVSRIYDPALGCILEDLEIDTICPTSLAIKEIGLLI